MNEYFNSSLERKFIDGFVSVLHFSSTRRARGVLLNVTNSIIV